MLKVGVRGARTSCSCSLLLPHCYLCTCSCLLSQIHLALGSIHHPTCTLRSHSWEIHQFKGQTSVFHCDLLLLRIMRVSWTKIDSFNETQSNKRDGTFIIILSCYMWQMQGCKLMTERGNTRTVSVNCPSLRPAEGFSLIMFWVSLRLNMH